MASRLAGSGAHVTCLHRGLVFSKLKNLKVEATRNVCKKDWNTVPIYSQHLVFFLFFVGGCDFMVSLDWSTIGLQLYLETGDP